jgi:glycosyltransferase involved in cell wall biosynthesis
MSRGEVVVFTPDVVGERMAGPGIRAWHFARQLARSFPTTLVAQLESFHGSVRAVQRNDLAARNLLRDAAVVIGQPTRELLGLDHRRQKLIFDLFDPVVLELRELYADGASLRDRIHLRREWGRLHAALRRGALLMAATQRQRDFYAGVSAVAGADNRDRWITVPFGVDEEPPIGDPILPRDPPIIVWGGGAWPWLDPATAIEAVSDLNSRGIRCRLLFLGTSRPNRDLSRLDQDPIHQLARQAENVILNEDWVPYRERARWLRSCKIAIMLHRRTIEADYSIRTRLFDAIWCSLPVVATAGGFAAELVEREGLGVVVEPSDRTSVSGGIERLLRSDDLYAQSVSNLMRIRETYLWSEVTRPLVQAVQAWIG